MDITIGRMQNPYVTIMIIDMCTTTNYWVTHSGNFFLYIPILFFIPQTNFLPSQQLNRRNFHPILKQSNVLHKHTQNTSSEKPPYGHVRIGRPHLCVAGTVHLCEHQQRRSHVPHPLSHTRPSFVCSTSWSRCV